MKTLLTASCLLVSSALMAAETAPAAKPAAPKIAAVAAAAPDGYFRAGFDVLGSFPFNPPEVDPAAKPGTPPPSAANQIPAAIKALDGKKVIVTGYMLPLKMDKGGLVTEFLLVSSPQACCYGVTPQINEFIVVKMAKAGVKSLMDTPVEFYGTLAVKEVFEEGYLSNIYTLDCEKMGKATAD